MDFERLGRLIRKAALDAGAEVMPFYGASPDKAGMGLTLKSDQSPVTAADYAANRVICAQLQAAFPALPLISEEEAHSHTQKARTFLIVDPLDGTKEFIANRPDFTINIAYIEEGKPLQGVIYAPAKQQLFYTLPNGQAVEERGPDFGPIPGPHQRLSVASPDHKALKMVASRSHYSRNTDAALTGYTIAEHVSAGSSLKFCLVAQGVADLYPRVGRTMEWDIAAGDAILRGAGGHVLRLNDHTTLAYGKPGWENPDFLACSPALTPAVTPQN